MVLNLKKQLAACGLVALVHAQQETFEEIFGEEEDPQLQDIWPKYDTTKFIAIPEGATNYNNPGHWQEGNYATVTNIVGDQDLEVQLTLHNPRQYEDYMYMQWIQMVDEAKSLDGKYYYESYSCTLEYREASIDNIDLNVFYPKGYKGFLELQYQTGKPEDIAESDQTATHPWIYVLKNSKITTDQASDQGTETCAFKRDFETSLSDIFIKADVTLKVMVGYKVYRGKFWNEPSQKGYSGQTFMEWTIVEGSSGQSLFQMSAALLAAALVITSF